MKRVAQMPTAYIAVNKGRVKVYNKNSNIPTYYLKKGQEFQIELFNPTTDTIKAKISLNNQAIAQGGLVLRPGERVFLERYIDVEKKFKFDTYEVSNSKAVKQAIEENGDFKVEFFKEDTRPAYVPYYDNYYGGYNRPYYGNLNGVLRSTDTIYGATTGSGGFVPTSSTGAVGQELGLTNIASTNTSYKSSSLGDGEATLDWMDQEQERSIAAPIRDNKKRKRSLLKSKKSKTIETGRVEEGSHSNQTLTYVNKKFYAYSFHKIEYKMFPVSQKVNTTQEISVKRYCTGCGAGHKPKDNFCNSCGAKV